MIKKINFYQKNESNGRGFFRTTWTEKNKFKEMLNLLVKCLCCVRHVEFVTPSTESCKIINEYSYVACTK